MKPLSANQQSTTVTQNDGTKMRGKGKQFVAHGKRVVMAFPGGAGYGLPSERPKELVRRDLARGYISVDTARQVYGLSQEDIAAVERAIETGQDI